jgi:hypothetical protein
MRLVELEPALLRQDPDDTNKLTEVSMQEAQYITFLCPKCREPKKAHTIGPLPVSVGETVNGWHMKGTSLEDVTFDNSPAPSSIQLLYGCRAHFSVANGEIVALS